MGEKTLGQLAKTVSSKELEHICHFSLGCINAIIKIDRAEEVRPSDYWTLALWQRVIAKEGLSS